MRSAFFLAGLAMVFAGCGTTTPAENVFVADAAIDTATDTSAEQDAYVFVGDSGPPPSTCGIQVEPVASALEPNGNLTVSASQSLRQTFMLEKDGLLSTLETVLMRCMAQESDIVTITLSQETDAGRQKLGTATATGKGLKAGQCGVIPGPLGTESITGSLFKFTPCVPLRTGEVYSFEATSVAGFRIGERFGKLDGGIGDPYPKGRLYATNHLTNNSTAEVANADLVFRLIMTDGRSELK